MSIEESTNTSAVPTYLEQVLVAALKCTKLGAILAMDNLQPHHAT